MKRRKRWFVFIGCTGASALAVIGLMGGPPPALGQTSDAAAWVTAWSTSQQALGNDAISNATVRMIARVTVPGDAVRIRLDNAFGTEPLTIGRASVGHRIQGAALAAGSSTPLTFDKAPGVVIPPGGTVWSDSVPRIVQARSLP